MVLTMGKPLEKSREMIEKIYELLPKGAYIAHSGVTGYGEAFLKRALGIDIGEVETMAHYRAARYFCLMYPLSWTSAVKI